jgi:hypothetical protein
MQTNFSSFLSVKFAGPLIRSARIFSDLSKKFAMRPIWARLVGTCAPVKRKAPRSLTSLPARRSSLAAPRSSLAAIFSYMSGGSFINGDVRRVTTAAEASGLGGIPGKFVSTGWRRFKHEGERGALGAVDSSCSSAMPPDAGGPGILPRQLPICVSPTT